MNRIIRLFHRIKFANSKTRRTIQFGRHVVSPVNMPRKSRGSVLLRGVLSIHSSEGVVEEVPGSLSCIVWLLVVLIVPVVANTARGPVIIVDCDTALQFLEVFDPDPRFPDAVEVIEGAVHPPQI